MSPPHPLVELIGAPVHLDTLSLGKVVSVFLDERWGRVIGLEVAGPGGVRRFLPWVGARIEPEGVQVGSPLLLIDQSEAYERLGAMSVHEPVHLQHLGVSTDGSVVSTSGVVPALHAGVEAG